MRLLFPAAAGPTSSTTNPGSFTLALSSRVLLTPETIEARFAVSLVVLKTDLTFRLRPIVAPDEFLLHQVILNQSGVVFG